MMVFVANWQRIDPDVLFTWASEQNPSTKWDTGRLVFQDTYPRNGNVRIVSDPIEWAGYGVLANTEKKKRVQRAITATLPANSNARQELISLPNDLRVPVQRVLCLARRRNQSFRHELDELISGAVAWVRESSASNPMSDPCALVESNSEQIRNWGLKVGYSVDLASAKTTFEGAYDFDALSDITPLLKNGITQLPSVRRFDPEDVFNS